MMREATPHRARGTGTAPAPSRRTCVVTRQEAEPEDLVRFVADPAGRIVPDVARKLPGRGVWVSCRRSAVEQAVTRGLFAKALKRKVIVPADLADEVDRRLLNRLLEMLSLANKAGLVIAGFAKVEAAIGRGKVRALLHAKNAAADGCAKLDRRFRAACRDFDYDGAILTLLDSDQLGLAIGQASVIHAALERGGATQALLGAAHRLARYRVDPVDTETCKSGPSGTGRSSLDEGHV